MIEKTYGVCDDYSIHIYSLYIYYFGVTEKNEFSVDTLLRNFLFVVFLVEL